VRLAWQPTDLEAARPFWAATAAGELRVPWCTSCDQPVVYPRDFCPACHAPVDTRNARGPTIGPVEMPPPPKRRSTQYLKAALVGLFAAVILLAVTTLVAKRINATTVPTPTPTPSPSPPPLQTTQTQTQTPTQTPTQTQTQTPTPTLTPSTTPTQTTSAEPTASVRPTTSATPHVPHPVPTATSRNNWLDRRK